MAFTVCGVSTVNSAKGNRCDCFSHYNGAATLKVVAPFAVYVISLFFETVS